jgi:UPF0716 protein FxsA
MLPVLFIVLLVLPLAELWMLIQVADVIGTPLALLLLVAISFAGAVLLKREGIATWRRLQTSLRAGKMPTNEVSDGALIMLGGALLLTPGFLTDIVGILLVLPPTRAVVKSAFRRMIGGYILKRTGAAGVVGSRGKRIYDARVVRSRRGPTRSAPTAGPPEISRGPSDPPDETV